MLIDTHCHLDRIDLNHYNNDLTLALASAKENSVEYFLNVCIDLDNFSKVLKIAETYPQVFASVGVHPNEILEKEPTVEDLVKLANHPKVIAFGETGLDYYREDVDKTVQQERFRTHIRAAKKLKKPIIVHTRQAREDTLQILKEEGASEIGGIMHCFTEDWDTAQKALALNFYISFSGIITFQNAKELQAVAKQVPLDRLLIETDSPYLAPVPYRGKPNEPKYVYYVAEALAKLKEVSFDEIADRTCENFFRLFNFTSQEPKKA